MKTSPEICIPESITAQEAWQKMNGGKEWHTLFVMDKKGKVLGSVTDGDIRRGILSGLGLDKPVADFANQKFKSVIYSPDVYMSFRDFSEKGLLRIPALNTDGQFIGYFDTQEQKAVLPIEAFILAGGKGRRMLPLTIDTPKSLLPVKGIPMLGRITDQLILSGVSKITFALHHEAERIEKFCREWVSDRINIQFIIEDIPLGTAGALNVLKPESPNILVMNSDLLTDLDPEKMYLQMQEKADDILIAAGSWKTEIPFALLHCSDTGRLISMNEKPVLKFPVNAGIYLLKSELISDLPFNQKTDMPDMINLWMSAGKNAGVYSWDGIWQDIGKPSEYEQYKTGID